MKKLGWILFYLFIFSFLLYNSFSYLDPDFGWHLRFGEIIWQTKSLPHDQIFMWSLQGKTWVDHEWLINLIMYGLWSVGGYILVSLFFALLPLLTIFIINKYLFTHFFKTTETRVATALLEVAAIITMAPHLGVRVQEVTLLATSLLLIILVRLYRDRKHFLPWWLPIFFYAWACLHAGFLIGLLFLFLWLCCEVFLYYVPYAKKFGLQPLSKEALLYTTVVSGLSFIFTLLTPYGFSLYHFLTDYRDTFYQTRIQEWLSPLTFPFHYKQIGLNLLVIVSFFGTFFSLRKKIPLFTSIIITLLVIMAFKSVRHFPLLMVGWFILILPHCLPELTSKIKSTFTKTALPLAVICLLCVSIYTLVLTRFTTNPFVSYCQSYPCQAVNFLKKNPALTNRIFNSYNFGGYTIGVAPEIRLFIDGRLPQYPYNNHSILEEYYLFYLPGSARKKLDENRVTTVFLQKVRPYQKPNWFEQYFLGYETEGYTKSTSLLAHISTSSNWSKVYEDQLSLIFVRK